MAAQGTVRMNRPRRGPGHGPGSMANVEKPKDMKGTLRKLLAFMGRYKALLFVVLFFAVLSTVFNIVGPKVLSLATTELFNGIMAKIQGTGSIDFWAIQKILMATMGLYVVSAACSFVQSWFMSSIAQNTAYELRRQIDRKFDRLAMGYFERTSTGDVLSRITNDVDTLGQSLNQGVTQLITSITTLIGVLVMMLSISWKLTLVTLVILPVSMVLLRFVVKHSQRYFKQQQEMLGSINGQIEETFAGHVVVKSFNQEGAAIESFGESNEKLYESAWKSQFISGLMHPIMNLVSNAGYAAVAILGSMMAVSGAITVGDIQAFIQYVKNFTQPIQQLTQVANVLQSMTAAAERVFEFLDEEEVEDWEAKAQAAILQGEVEFKHVRFGYDPEVPVIKDFNA
ncbi:MAG: ABC transporter ATP-binding protein, partial [Coriobacteriaceae bacterium]|nr:ABC transporter ATP-binding protein [Coriobacteriaceae bacterium]